MDQWDYIVVGAGSAGCVVACRLTEDPSASVLLLEAGGMDDSMWVKVPAGFMKLLAGQTGYTWPFTSEPAADTGHRGVPITRGKGLGGSSSVNGMAYVRGQPQDYDTWAQLGARGWSFDEILPFYLRMENYPGSAPDRGHAGPVHISTIRPDTAADVFMAAAEAEGVSRNPDYNGRVQEGTGPFQATLLRGRRWSAADAYIRPAIKRTNFKMETHAHVTRLIVENGRCVGVRYRRDGDEHEVRARREVVLSAGGIQSPQLLELSGIGRPDVLRPQGIEIQHPLMGVGENYRDHYGAQFTWRLKNVLTFNERTHGLRMAGEVLRYFWNRTGVLSSTAATVVAFVRSRPEISAPDIQFHVVSASFADSAHGRLELDKEPGMTILVYQCRPESAGSVHIASPDPMAAPCIRTNFISTELDRRTFNDGVRVARRIMANPVMNTIRVAEVGPGAAAKTDDQLIDFLRRTGQTSYHGVGTCRMGEDADAVVDSRLRVRGLAGLRVVDASVMPRLVSGNTNAASLLIGEKGADMIRADARYNT